MKEGELRELLGKSGLDPFGGTGRVSVLVSLHAREADAPMLAHLVASGLEIDRVIGNTVLGTILSAKVPALRRDKSVCDVEPSMQLKPHSSGEPS